MEQDIETGECRCCKEMVAKAAKCIREHPTEAAAASAIGGFLFAQFPLRGLARMALRLLKPVAILYGLYRLAEDCHAGRWNDDTRAGS